MEKETTRRRKEQQKVLTSGSPSTAISTKISIIFSILHIYLPYPSTTMPRITPAAILRSATATRQPLASRAAIRPLIFPASPSRLAAPRRYQSTFQQPNEQSATENKESDPKSTESKPEDAKKAKKGLKISWIFSGLAGLGALVTIYGLYVQSISGTTMTLTSRLLHY